MRAFFKEILLNLYIYCGNRQADKMSVEEVDTLLSALERMSKIYSYIPEEKQKEIILTCLVSDREYQNINVRTVSKWLEQNGKVFFTQECHLPTEQKKPPVEGEEREKWLEIWRNQLAKIEENIYPDRTIGSGSRMKEHLDKVAPIPESESALNEYCNEQASNKEGSEGTTEDSGLPENSSNPSEQNNDSQDQEIIS